MAQAAVNTGKKAYVWLIEINSATGQPTGRRKLNLLGDPDYIAPIDNPSMCPISTITWRGVDPICQVNSGSNTGYVIFQKRERLIDGVSDGYLEDNVTGANYIPPVYDINSCPL